MNPSRRWFFVILWLVGVLTRLGVDVLLSCFDLLPLHGMAALGYGKSSLR